MDILDTVQSCTTVQSTVGITKTYGIKYISEQARGQTGAIGAIAPSAGPIALSGASLCTLCTYLE